MDQFLGVQNDFSFRGLKQISEQFSDMCFCNTSKIHQIREIDENAKNVYMYYEENSHKYLGLILPIELNFF
jgi:hypothetical protein